MAGTLKHHHELTNGVGKCSMPMWANGIPEGFCDAPAYGHRRRGYEYRDGYGNYTGYCPGLACPAHGGPPPTHFRDPCVHCGTPHDEVAVGPCNHAHTAAIRTGD